MNALRLVRAGTPVEVAVLALMSLILGAGCLALAAFPLAPDAPREVIVGFGLVGVTVALALVLARDKAGPVHLHTTVVVLTALIGAMVAVAATERGLMMSVLGYIWIAVYVAFFFSRDAARLHAGLMVAALGLSLLAARAPTDVSVWIVISVMVWAAVCILTNLNARLRAEAHIDSLTGLLNRSGLAAAAARQRGMAKRTGEPVALSIIDLDDFKLVNDQGGHAAGDRLLVELASVWSAALRPGDLLARFGGDEFVLMLTGVAEDEVDAVLGRLAQAHPTSWTAGAAVIAGQESLDEVINRADERLYHAKQLRRETIEQTRSNPTVRSALPSPAQSAGSGHLGLPAASRCRPTQSSSSCQRSYSQATRSSSPAGTSAAGERQKRTRTVVPTRPPAQMSRMYSKPSRPTWPHTTTSAPRLSSSSASGPPSRGGRTWRRRPARGAIAG